MARKRSRARRQAARRESERLLRRRRGALRLRPPAARCARVLRQVPGADSVREGQLPAGRISVLLACVRDQRRVLRLLPRLPRVLEVVRNRTAGSGLEEALLSECLENHAGHFQGSRIKARLKVKARLKGSPYTASPERLVSRAFRRATSS